MRPHRGGEGLSSPLIIRIDEVDYSFVYTDEKVGNIMKTVSLYNFIYSKYLKYIAHICRAENITITKMLFAKPREKYCRDPWINGPMLICWECQSNKRIDCHNQKLRLTQSKVGAAMVELTYVMKPFVLEDYIV